MNDTYMRYCGIRIIDEQHEKLIWLMDELKSAYAAADHVRMQAVLTNIRWWAVTHFETEEALMLKAHYFDIKNHTDVHLDYIEAINKAVDEFEKTGIISIRTLMFLESWIVDHIDVEAEMFETYLVGALANT